MAGMSKFICENCDSALDDPRFNCSFRDIDRKVRFCCARCCYEWLEDNYEIDGDTSSDEN